MSAIKGLSYTRQLSAQAPTVTIVSERPNSLNENAVEATATMVKDTRDDGYSPSERDTLSDTSSLESLAQDSDSDGRTSGFNSATSTPVMYPKNRERAHVHAYQNRAFNTDDETGEEKKVKFTIGNSGDSLRKGVTMEPAKLDSIPLKDNVRFSKNNPNVIFIKREDGNKLKANQSLSSLDSGINGDELCACEYDDYAEENSPPDRPTSADEESQNKNSVSQTNIHHKPIKPGKQRFRWNLLFNFLLLLIVPLPIWLPFVSNTAAIYAIPAVQAVFVLMWLIIGILALRTLIILVMKRNYDFKQDYPAYTDIRHLMAISCYKEPVELIARSVQSLADQTEVGRISMVISFEQKTPELETKIQRLSEIFGNCGFERLIFTVHPFGRPNEIPGKCSNANYGLRKSVQVLEDELGVYFDPKKIIVTTCDADSKFHPRYVEALTSKFLSEKTPYGVVFQAPLLYNWGLDGASFITRVTGLLRETLMMGALIPFNINSMSIFSFSLQLCIDGNFVHPAYQMDDIICLIRWMGVTRRRIRTPLIPVPVISGPTSGETVEIEIAEWARQARRWTIGAAEVFHYYVCKAGRMPFFPAFTWGVCFLVYYGILLCSGGLYGISALCSMLLLVKDIPDYINYTMYGLAGLQQLIFLVPFIIDVVGPRLMKIKEHISFVRNFFHWVFTPLVLLGYSLVELYALFEVMIRGKEVCKHGASKKGALAS